MNYISKFSITQQPQNPEFITRAVQVGRYKDHAIEVVVAYDPRRDEYRAHTYVTRPEGERTKLQMGDVCASGPREAFRLGWQDADQHLSSWSVGSMPMGQI
jgi:hypothetical protein